MWGHWWICSALQLQPSQPLETQNYLHETPGFPHAVLHHLQHRLANSSWTRCKQSIFLSLWTKGLHTISVAAARLCHRQQVGLVYSLQSVGPWTIDGMNFKVPSLALKTPHPHTLSYFHRLIVHHSFEQMIITPLLCCRLCAKQWGYAENKPESHH